MYRHLYREKGREREHAFAGTWAGGDDGCKENGANPSGTVWNNRLTEKPPRIPNCRGVVVMALAKNICALQF
jgi:hypothetical protein